MCLDFKARRFFPQAPLLVCSDSPPGKSADTELSNSEVGDTMAPESHESNAHFHLISHPNGTVLIEMQHFSLDGMVLRRGCRLFTSWAKGGDQRYRRIPSFRGRAVQKTPRRRNRPVPDSHSLQWENICWAVRGKSGALPDISKSGTKRG